MNLSSHFGSKEARGVSIKVTLKPIEMEYRIDFKSKYATLQINTTLDWKKMNEKQKMTWTQIPLGGMGNGLERAYSKLFLLPALQYQQTDMMPLDSYTEWNQELTKCKN